MQQVKSKQRVKAFGEVFTASREVDAMCNLIPEEIWSDLASTYLEPACGTGNFLKEILRRKLAICKTDIDAVVACRTVFGIDIQEDNVQESRQEMKKIVLDRFPCVDVDAILERNIVCGDVLFPETVWFLMENYDHPPIELTGKKKLFALNTGYASEHKGNHWYYAIANTKTEAKAKMKEVIPWLEIYAVREETDRNLISCVLVDPKHYICIC